MEWHPHSNIDLDFESSASKAGKYLVLDTETTGLISKQSFERTDPGNLPRVIQIAWFLFDATGKKIASQNRFILQDSPIPPHTIRIHGIDDTYIHQKGEKPSNVWNDFLKDVENCEYLVAHNIDFDIPVIESELARLNIYNAFAGKRMICTMKHGMNLCKIPAEDGNGYRYPALDDLYKFCFFGRLTDQTIEGLHDALVDAAITAKVFLKMVSDGLVIPQDSEEKPFIMAPVGNEDKIEKSRFFFNIILPTFLTIILFLLSIFLIIIPRFRENIMVGKQQMIKELTNSASSILEKYESDERNGLLSKEEAQKTAISRIQYLRYGDEKKDYFWITDMNPDMIMHPYRNDLNGKSLQFFKDPHGKKLFVEMVKVAGKDGEGYVEYMWQWKDDSTHIVPKLSFVKLFKPWGWIIGTGIYIEDVKKEISSLTKRLILISSGISAIIAFLLTYITLQSMKIERQRKKSNRLLHLSREKYKTLVEATTEGLIMVIDNRMIFSNNKIHKLTGFSETELSSQPFSYLINKGNSPVILKAFQNRELPEGQWEMILSSKNRSQFETIATITSIVFYDKKGKLITIKDTSVQKRPEGNTEDLLQLLEFADMGFIRFLFDSRGTILFAGKMVVKLLGFDSLKELTQYGILDFFLDPAQKNKYRKKLLGEGKISNETIQIRKKDGCLLEVIFSMILVKNEFNQLLCDSVIINHTEKEREKWEAEALISQLQVHQILLQNSVDTLIKPVSVVTFETSSGRIIELMKENQTDAVLVSDGQEMMGIITMKDIIDRILLSDKNFGKPASEIMITPLICVDSGVAIGQALQLMLDAGISHLPVRSPSETFLGIIHKNDLFPILINSISFTERKIEHAVSVTALSAIFKEFMSSLLLMIHQNIQPVVIGKLFASVSDGIIRKLIGFATDESGPPPVDFTFIVLGSEGRMEQTLATDQDNAIIYADVPEEKAKEVQSYFNNLGEIVCDNLDSIGLRYCKGRIMAKNPVWTKPLKTWKSYFSQWVSNTEPKNLLDVSIFFDFRPVYGNSRFTDELREHIYSVSDGNGSFFYNLADNILTVRSSTGLTGNILTERREEKVLFDLKGALMPYIMFARIYSIYNKSSLLNTDGRIRALNKSQVIPLSMFRELIYGYTFLMQLRYRNQASQMNKGQEINNYCDLKELSSAEESAMKKIISQLSEMQNKLNIDFKRSVL